MSAYDEMMAKALARSAVGLADQPGDSLSEEKRRKFQALEYNRLKVEAQQARARGIMTQEDYDQYISGDTSNAIQKMLRLDNKNNTGGVLETIGDVLSLGNYAVASVAKATLDTGYDIGGFKIGFAPESFAQAWHNKT